MATITKRGKSWLAQVRRKGFPAISKTFETRGAAKTWATLEEARIDSALPQPADRLMQKTTLGDLMVRYLLEVTSTKRGADVEEIRIGCFQNDPIASFALNEIGPSDIAAFRDRRLRQVKPATVRRELTIVRHIFEVARREWGHPLTANPAAEVRRPADSAARDRRLAPGEYARLMQAVAGCYNKSIEPIIVLAIHTGLRRSELLGLSWRRVDLERRLAHIPLTKTGKPRTVPLTGEACAILSNRQRSGDSIFSVSPTALRLAWSRITKRSGLVDLRFHDLRHEAISRFFEMGLSLPEVALISGHRDPRMLFRYTHLRPETLANKLADLSRG